MSLGPALAGHWTSACPSVQGAGGPDVSPGLVVSGIKGLWLQLPDSSGDALWLPLQPQGGGGGGGGVPQGSLRT